MFNKLKNKKTNNKKSRKKTGTYIKNKKVDNIDLLTEKYIHEVGLIENTVYNTRHNIFNDDKSLINKYKMKNF